MPRYLPAASRAKAQADARRALAELAGDLAPHLPAGAKIECETRVGPAHAEIGRVGDAVDARLVVLGRGGKNGLRELFVGSTAERVVRGAALPVLVVRNRARKGYQRPLLAATVEEPLPRVLGLLMQLLPARRPPMAWVHAFDAPFRGLIYPSLSREQSADYEKVFQRRAHAEVYKRIAAARVQVSPEDVARWRAVVLPGSPRWVIPNTVGFLRADLLAMGTQGLTGLPYAMLGTVAGDVLRDVPCDVLVVPCRGKRK